MSSSNKFQAEKNQRVLLELVNQPGNDVCADCKARAPRWASHNLGIFICVNCASIHRKIGTHITKVKSLTLDSWSKEQVENMKQNGNIKSNALYNPDEIRHPPPANLIDSERDSELEKYIRNKYEFKTYMQAPPRSSSFGRFPPVKNSPTTPDRSAAVAALLGPSRSAASLPPRQQSSSVPSASVSATSQNLPATTSTAPSQITPAASLPPSLPPGVTRNPLRSASHPVSLPTQPPQPQIQQSGVWGDLQSLQPKTIDATLPLQVAAFPPNMSAATQSMALPTTSSAPFMSVPRPNPFSQLSASSGAAFPSTLQQQPGTVGRSMSLGSGLSAAPTGMSFGSSPFQPGLQTLQASPLIPQQTLTPSPNPFSPQPIPAGSMSMGMGVGGFTPSPQPPTFTGSASPFGQPTFAQQPSQPQTFQQQPQMFQPQPTGQFAPITNPYAQTQSAGPGTPFLTTTPQAYAGSTPSPFGQMQQPMQQMPVQQGYGTQPVGNANTNPFTSWMQQPPQQQQRW